MPLPGSPPTRSAVVTGATSGIGRAIAAALARDGAALWLSGRDAHALEDLVMELRRLGAPKATACRVDLAREAEVAALGKRLAEDLPPLDVVVHSAGAHATGPFASTPAETLDEQYRVNVRAPYVLTQALLPALREARGQVVFVNSSTGLAAPPNVALYAASKAALKALADSLRAEVNADGVRVLSVYPGRTASRMQAALCQAEGRPYRPERLAQPEDVAALVIAALALPRTAEVTDLAVRPMLKG